MEVRVIGSVLYARFDLELLDDEECLLDFQFTKQDVIRAYHAFGLQDKIKTLNCHAVSSVEALSIVLRNKRGGTGFLLFLRPKSGYLLQNQSAWIFFQN